MALSSKSARCALGQHVTVQYVPTEKPRGAQAAFSIVAVTSTATPADAQSTAKVAQEGALTSIKEIAEESK